jgi:carboxypeptidase family protein
MKLCTLVLAALVAASPAAAQTHGGNITGAVRDQQGGAIAAASVTAQAADARHTTTSDDEGSFRFLNLPPGRYTVTASSAGFAITSREAIVQVGGSVDLSLELRVAPVVETLTVNAASPILDPRASGTATNFSASELTSIPTARDPFSLARGVPGVLMDRVNVGGNETGQQPLVLAKGGRQQDTSWTLDGVEITDMGAAGQSPTYFNFDNFEEVHVATAGHDISARTGGVALDFVLKRGTNRTRGGLRGYFTSDSLEGSNVPDELTRLAVPVTPDTADHTKQLSDYGFDVGGPIASDRAWFYASYSLQDIRLVRRAGALIDRTKLENSMAKVNWQATPRDMLNFVFFNGSKLKDYRSPGVVQFDAPTATFHQDNWYSDAPLRGLWKIGDDRVIGATTFLSAKYAYYNTGTALTPMGGMDMQAGRSVPDSRSYGSFQRQVSARPQHTVNADVNWFGRRFGVAHAVRYGTGYRKIDIYTENLWPGNGILGLEQSRTDLRAQVFRQGNGGNRVKYFDLYASDSIALDRMTIDFGVRYDRQWGAALPSDTLGSPVFPEIVPGIQFAGYESPFTWNNLSPRAGINVALDSARRTLARASYSRHAAQLASTVVGYVNPTSTAGSMTFRWVDANQDHFAQAEEVLTTQQVGSPGGGFNPANPTGVTSANQIDADLTAPITQSFVAGVDREVMSNLAVGVSYTRTRTSNLFGNLSGNITPRVGVTLEDYSAGPTLTGALPDGTPYSVETFIPSAAKVTAGGGGFRLANIPGYTVDYNGLELTLVKRLSQRWMGRVAFAFNDAREHFSTAAGRYDTNGNPTRTVAEPLVDGGQHAPQPSVGVYLNAKWQFSANGMYQTPYGFEVSASVFGRQGYPMPIYRSQALGSDTLSVLVSPKVDTFRLDNLWNTDLRVARAFRVERLDVRLIGDLFNAFNANTELVRVNNIGATNFNALSQNLSPRIFRIGLVVGF